MSVLLLSKEEHSEERRVIKKVRRTINKTLHREYNFYTARLRIEEEKTIRSILLKMKMSWLKDYLYHYRSLLVKKKLLQQAVFYVMLPCAIFFLVLFINPHPVIPSPMSSGLPPPSSTTHISEQDYAAVQSTTSCDYTDGNWIPTNKAPLYNSTTCGQTIRNRQNCIYNGRPDLGYLYWQWKPTSCQFPTTAFNPSTILNSYKHKHIAFIGDSIARNQAESLICLLSSHSQSPQLIYSYPDTNAKFRRWRFPSHNLTVSVYWSPFLVNGIERSTATVYYNTMFLNSIDNTWAKDIPKFDIIILSIGHWFHYQGVYYENGTVLGSHGCTTLNHTEIGFHQAFHKAYRTAFNTIIDRTSPSRNVDVVVTTFMPQHFDGDDWGKRDACSMTRPYEAGEVEIQGVIAEMRRITLHEVEEINKKLDRRVGVRVTALDITKLSLLRPDGHPGPYMNPFPFAKGIKERVQNDCLHFCLPGPIDTWNQIMFEFVLNR